MFASGGIMSRIMVERAARKLLSEQLSLRLLCLRVMKIISRMKVLLVIPAFVAFLGFALIASVTRLELERF